MGLCQPDKLRGHSVIEAMSVAVDPDVLQFGFAFSLFDLPLQTL